MNKNFYEILNAAPNATLEELKSNYKHLILQCHPDKVIQQHQQQQQQQPDGNNLCHADKLENDLNNKEFVAISEAWNCLKDPSKRKHYDAELLLNKFQTHNNIYAHIQLSEMKKCLLKKNTDDGDVDVDVELINDGNKTEDVKGMDADSKGVMKSDSDKEASSLSYFYSYDCRCGGQYIVDESAEQYCIKVNSSGISTADVIHSLNDGDAIGGDVTVTDDADYNENNNSPNKTAAQKNDGGNGGGGGGVDGGILNDGLGRGGVDGSVSIEGVDFDEDNGDDDDDDNAELIVECSECSLVIILNG